MDRYTRNNAVIEEDGILKDVLRSAVNESAKEGAVLVMKNGIYTPDVNATEKRRKKN